MTVNLLRSTGLRSCKWRANHSSRKPARRCGQPRTSWPPSDVPARPGGAPHRSGTASAGLRGAAISKRKAHERRGCPEKLLHPLCIHFSYPSRRPWANWSEVSVLKQRCRQDQRRSPGYFCAEFAACPENFRSEKCKPCSLGRGLRCAWCDLRQSPRFTELGGAANVAPCGAWYAAPLGESFQQLR